MDDALTLTVAGVVLLAFAVLFVSTTTAHHDRAGALRGVREDRGHDRSEEGGDHRVAGRTSTSGRALERRVALERHGGRRAEGAPTPSPPAPPRAPADPGVLAVTRRHFFNRSITGFFTLGLAGFGSAAVAFLWPTLSGGFGSKVRAGKADEITDRIDSTREAFYVASARTWIVPYPRQALPAAEKAYSGAVLEGMKEGFIALYQKCPHLGCRVPFCTASQWFECPCHGSKFNRAGEKKAGPAPRGMDRFALAVEGGAVVVDTSKAVQGPPIGVNTTGQEAEGPHCV